MSKLEEILRAEVEAEINEILAEADARAAKIVGEAEKLAAARVAERRRRIDAEIHAAWHRARSTADLTLASARLQAKGEVMDLLLEKVMRALEQVPSRPNYAEVIQALAREAMEVAGAAETLVVHPDDLGKMRQWAEGVGLRLEKDPELRLGVRIVSKKGTVVENTLPERLQRVWGALAPQATAMLWE